MSSQPSQPGRLRPADVAALSRIVGPQHISTALPDRIAYARGVWPPEFKWVQSGHFRFLPDAVVWPGSPEEVAEIVAWAHGAGCPVIGFGGGSGIVGGVTPVQGGITVDLKRLTRVEVDPVACTVWAGAGLFGQTLEEILNRRGFTLGHFPQSMHSSTVGGWLAHRAAGVFSTKYGKIEDMTVAVEAVVPPGRVIRTHPAPRPSTGPNLVELLLGTEGTICLFTGAMLRIRPLPERRVYMSFAFDDLEAALDCIRRTVQRGVLPGVVRLYDETETWLRFRGHGLERGESLLLLVFEGDRRVVEAEVAVAREICAEAGRELPGTIAQAWWATRLDTRRMLLALRRPGGVSDAIEVSAPWPAVYGVYQAMRRSIEGLADAVYAHFSHIYHHGASLYLIFEAEVPGNPEAGEARYYQILDRLFAAATAAGASVSHHHGIGLAKGRWLARSAPDAAWVMEALKRAFDPANIMNPGKLTVGTERP